MNNSHLIIILLVIILVFDAYARFPDYGNDNKVRVWEPVIEQDVLGRLYEFLITNNVTNCFEFEEERTHLLLKCWSNQYMVDVSVMTRNQFPFVAIQPGYSTNVVAC